MHAVPFRSRATLSLAAVLLASACGGSPTPTAPKLGSLAVGVSGLPGSAGPTVTVSGPAGFTRSVGPASATLSALSPGTYIVTASTVTTGGVTYEAAPPTQSVLVSAGGSVSAAVSYTAASGTLALTVSGLPPGTNAAVTITGPSGYSSTQTASATLSGLVSGSYTVAAASVGTVTQYDPSPTTQTVSVASNATASAAVNYTVHSSASLNLRIDGFYVTQSVQTYNRTVPLVAGRDGFLRVFAVANQSNTARPDVRARFYRAGTLVQTVTIPAPGVGVPTDTVGSQASLSRTWNASLPASLLQPGLDIVLDVDPNNLIPESNDLDNSYPVNGTPLSLNLQTVATLNLRFVPILRTADNTTGNVTAANAAQFADLSVRMHPLAAVNIDVRAPYVYSDTAQIQSNDGNGVWLRILSQINTLQTTEGGTRNYYGVVAVPYGGGVAGYGYQPGRASVGWDKLPSASGVAAHELGHNFGRGHAPCGNPDSPDPNYPYAGGVTGQWGYDMVAGVLKPPTDTDLMSYCSNNWISDYNYVGVLNQRGAAGSVQVGASREPSLIVWGTIRDGQVVLEPAFEATTNSRLPSAAGPNLVRGFDAAGGEAFRLAFSGSRVADAPGNPEQFAFAVPLRMIRGSLAELRLESRGQEAVLRTTGARKAGRATGLTLERAGGRSTVRWNAADYPLAVIRDAATGRIVSLASGGRVTLDQSVSSLDVTVSDRAESRTEHLR